MFRFLIITAVLAITVSGCKSTAEYRADADEEAYRIIREKQKRVHGEERPYSVETEYSHRSPEEISPDEVINSRLEQTAEPVVIKSLQEALVMAVSENRDYQRRKESLMLAALTLSDTRHSYDTLFSHSTTAERERTSGGRDAGSVDSKLSVDKLLKSGGSLGLTLANSLFRFYSGDPARTATSTISVNLVQPLLRGAGKDIAAEGLTQAERNVVYEVRAFSRYQKTFAVQVAEDYFRLIQRRDTVYNEYNNYKNLITARKRAEALSRDRLPEFEVDQTRQSELQARNRYISAVERYQSELDAFKIELGLSLDQKLQITEGGLERLNALGMRGLVVSPEAAFDVALKNRLDFLTSVDKYDDAKRKVNVAENELLSDVEIFADASLESSGDRKFERFNFKNWSGGVGLKFKLPLDRLLERNDYRRELIDFERELRALALAVDELKTDIRTAIRNLDERAQTYRIQKLSVDLAKRRVESANLLLEAGRASTRDLLEAQDALVVAQNNLTRSFVDYHLARLRLLRDIGMIDLRDGDLVELMGIDQAQAEQKMEDGDVKTPEELFGKEK